MDFIVTFTATSRRTTAATNLKFIVTRITFGQFSFVSLLQIPIINRSPNQLLCAHE